MKNLLPNPSPHNNIEELYDIHAANMYGCIYKIVQNKKEAEKILINIFHDLLATNAINVQALTPAIWFIKYAIKSTYLYLKKINSPMEEFNSFKKIILEQANKY